MPLSLKQLLVIIFIFPVVSASANKLIDTTRKIKQPQTTTTIANSAFSENNFFLQGVEAIQKDSVDKGIHIIAESLRPFQVQPKYKYALDYNTLELIETIRVLDSGKLSTQEMDAGRLFFKLLFTNKIESNLKDMEPAFNKNHNSVFMLRLKLLAYAEAGDNRMNNIATELLKIQPRLLTVNILKAKYYFDKDNYTESAKWCTKTIQIFPKYTYAWYLRGKCYESLKKGDMAIADFDEALHLFPLHPEAAFDRSNILLDSDKYREAVAGFRWALKTDPEYGYPAYNLALCYKGLDMRDSALYYVNDHINKYPDDGDGYDLKGDILDDNGDKTQAINFFNSAIKLEPEDESFYEDRGACYIDIDSLNLAIPDFKKAISLNKKRAYPEDRLGDCYYEREEYPTALTHYQQALRIDPTYKYAYVDIDLIYNKQGKHKEGIELLKKALAIDSTYNLAIGNLGWEYYCIGDYDGCIKYSYKALSFESDASYAMFNIALATLCKGDFEKAKERYTYFYNLCKQNNYDLHIDGATADLRDLIKANRYKEEATYIIQNIFGQEP